MSIKYLTIECSIVITHLWEGTDLKDIPRTGSGNTKIGHFPEIPTEVLTSEVTYSYPITAGETYFVLAHAIVDCLYIGRETA